MHGVRPFVDQPHQRVGLRILIVVGNHVHVRYEICLGNFAAVVVHPHEKPDVLGYVASWKIEPVIDDFVHVGFRKVPAEIGGRRVRYVVRKVVRAHVRVRVRFRIVHGDGEIVRSAFLQSVDHDFLRIDIGLRNGLVDVGTDKVRGHTHHVRVVQYEPVVGADVECDQHLARASIVHAGNVRQRGKLRHRMLCVRVLDIGPHHGFVRIRVRFGNHERVRFALDQVVHQHVTVGHFFGHGYRADVSCFRNGRKVRDHVTAGKHTILSELERHAHVSDTYVGDVRDFGCDRIRPCDRTACGHQPAFVVGVHRVIISVLFHDDDRQVVVHRGVDGECFHRFGADVRERKRHPAAEVRERRVGRILVQLDVLGIAVRRRKVNVHHGV